MHSKSLRERAVFHTMTFIGDIHLESAPMPKDKAGETEELSQ